MVTLLDYAALSAIIYNDKRSDINKLLPDPPAGWTELLYASNPGFTAGAYQNGNDIVIAFKGSDPPALDSNGIYDWAFANLPSGFGIGSTQLVDAALFYEAVKAANPGANITFTGHSLGGGIASVMAVWFDKHATTFDEAPFLLSAVNPVFTIAVAAKFLLNGISDSDFSTIVLDPFAVKLRSTNVEGHYVSGEFLNYLRSPITAIYGSDTAITIGGGDAVSSFTLHSINLAASLLMSQIFADDTILLPKLLAEIFDKNLYSKPLEGTQKDFLTGLLNDQIRVGYDNTDGLLARFSGDVDKLTQYDANLKDGALGKALIDVAIADYYFMQSGFTKDFFNAINGGISFDLADIQAPNGWASNKTVSQLDNAIISQYLNDDQTARNFLAQDNYWSIQSGSNALNAIGTGTNNDAMIGGATDDIFDGGAGNDFLYGGDGADTLTGGAGDDILEGGTGNDTLDGGAEYDIYIIEGNDTIRDSDGLGTIKDKAGNIISGAIEKNADGTYVYLSDPSISVTLDANLTLILADGIVATIENFQGGDLGLQLVDMSTQAATNTITGDIIPDDIDPNKAGIQAAADANGNPVGTAGPYEDILGGTAGNDHILSGELNDDIGGGAGNDWIEGGTGSDYIGGGAGDDLIEGDAGSDILIGEDNNDQIYGNAKISITDAIDSGNTDSANNVKGDWLTGNSGDDQLIAGASNDVLAGGGGNDLIIAGAGDDYILGDADYIAQYIWEVDPRYSIGNTNWFHSDVTTFDWTVTPQPDVYLFQPVVGEINPADSGNDVIYAGNGNDHVWAGTGNDVVDGEGGDDIIIGEAGNDILSGGAGNDTITGDASYIDASLHGDDYIDGGDGSDILYGQGGNDILLGGEGDDTLWGGDGNDLLYGGAGDDQLYGEQGANYIDGGDGNDIINSGGPGSELYGGAGDDDISAADGSNYLDGEDGNDTIAADGGDNELFGGAGDDDLSASGGNNYLDGEEGNNTLLATDSDNILYAGAGDDTLSAGGGRNYLDGGDGSNLLIADGGGNELYGGAGDDTLSAGGGNNHLDGGDGSNLLVSDGGGNFLFAGTGNDTLSSTGGGSYLDAGDGNDTLIADGGGSNTLIGGTGDDTLSSAGGYSYLDGGDGADYLIADGGGNTLAGGTGDDILVAHGGGNYLDGGDGMDLYVFDAGFGVDHIVDAGSNDAQFNFNFAGSGITVGLGSLKLSFANGDVLHIDGFDPNDPLNTCSITTFQFSDQTLGLQQILDLGGDAIQPSGADINGTADADVLQGTDLREKIFGLAGNDIIYAMAGNDTIEGGDGNDTIDGGAGYDRMIGGTGDDTCIVDNASDLVIEQLNEGWDTVQSSVSYTLGNHLEELTLTGAVNLDGTGNALDNVIMGNDGVNTLSGLDGNDNLYGEAGSDTLLGGNGDDMLNGGTGADAMAGGAGNDHYLVDDSGDTVTENLNGGIDMVHSSVSYTLGDDIENLGLTGTTSIAGSGNELNNRIDGNDSDNTLSGLGGNDTLFGWGGTDTLLGGAGDDTYYVGDESDVVIENLDEGADVVASTVNYTLFANVENLFLTGAGNIGTGNGQDNQITAAATNRQLNYTLSGGAGNDRLAGLYYNDTLEGGTGADVMIGDYGNDTYIVDNAGDYVYELFNRGIDTVQSSISYILSAYLENLTLTGMENLDGTGNDLNNIIIGNNGDNTLDGGAGNDTLNGGAGADVMTGGTGNDIYYVDAASTALTPGDVILESSPSGGTDQVYSSVTFALGANVENLTLTGYGNIDGTGNELGNNLIGNSGDNTLSGGAGNDMLDGGQGTDAMDGGDGQDSYYVDNLGDTVTENSVAGGYDQVYATVDFTLGANVEGLNLINLQSGTGQLAIIGTGNDLDNYINGDDADNVLSGEAGNDDLEGGVGSDIIAGGTGDDSIFGGPDGRWTWRDGLTFTSNDTLDGGDGNDYIDGETGNDTIIGGAGDDTLYGGYEGDDYESPQFFAGNDVIDGGDGDDYIDGESGADTLLGGAGDDYIYGGDDGNTTYHDFATDSDINVSSDDYLDGGDGNDILDGGTGDDTLVAGSGNDTLYGGEDNDVLYGSNRGGPSAGSGQAGASSTDGGSGDGSGGAEVVDLGTTAGGGGGISDNLAVQSGEDDGSIPLANATGEAYTYTLQGYIGDGPYANQATGIGHDTDFYQFTSLSVGQTITASTMTGFDTVIGLYDSTGNLVVMNDDADGTGGSSNSLDSSFSFTIAANGDYYLAVTSFESQLPADPFASSSGGSVNISGGNYVTNVAISSIHSGGDASGNSPGSGDFAVMEGGAGDDSYWVGGTYGLVTGTVLDDCGDPVSAEHLQWYTDTVVEYGGEGYDIVFSSASYALTDNVEELHLTFDPAMASSDPQMYADQLTFGQDGIGNSLDNIIIGDQLANRLIGRAGNDTLTGGAGDDRYVFRLGDGADTIFDSQGHDTLFLGSDLTAADISLQRNGNDVLVSVNGTTSTSSGQASDSIAISGWFAQTEGVSQIEFCDTSVLDRLDIAALLDSPLVSQPLPGQVTLEDDPYNFTVPADSFINPRSGSMLSYSATMADGSALPSWLTFDAATQTFSGTPTNWDVAVLDLSVTAASAGGNTASNGFELDVLNVNDAPTVINPLPDQVVTAGQAFKFAAEGNVAVSFLSDPTDTGTPDQVGMDYDNYLNGGDDNDVYSFAQGDGNVYISEWGNSPMDILQFADVLPVDITLSQNQWGDVILSVNGTADSLTLSGWISYEEARIEQVVFSDNTMWDVNHIMSMISTSPTNGSDYITTANVNSTILAQGGDDVVWAGTGNDLIFGEAGNDRLIGGGGSDLLSGGSGADEIDADWDYNDGSNDLLMGSAGEDGLQAGIANDLLIGGTENDVLSGDDGSNVILFNRGDGNDWIDPWNSGIIQKSDTVSLGGGIEYADLSFRRNGDDLVLDTGNGDSITFNYWFATWGDFKAVNNLQIITEDMAAYDQNSVDPLLSQLVQRFDFAGLANQFEADLANDPNIISWQLVQHLADYSLGGSDSAAIGGDMAYLYGKNGNLDGLNEAELRAQLADAQFGVDTQTLTKAGGNMFDDVDFIHGDTLTYSATLANGDALPSWLHFNEATQTFSGTAGNSDAGILNVAVIATDTGGLNATDLFELDVIGLNEAPNAASDLFEMTEDESMATLAVSDLLANDTDPDAGDSLSMAGFDAITSQGNAITQDINGNLALDVGNRYQSLGAGQSVTDNFSYTIADSAGATSSATVTVTINGVNDGPVASSDSAAVQEDVTPTATGNVLGNDSDVDQGTVLSVANAGVFSGSYGSLELDADGGFSYALDNASLAVQSLAAGQTATETFAYQATDGLVSTPSTLTVTITGTNDAPVVAADTAAVQEDVTLTATGNVLSNDSDVDQGTALLVANAGIFVGSYGQLALAADGSYVYTLDNGSGDVQALVAGQVVGEVFAYRVTDGIATTESTLNVTISGTNDGSVIMGSRCNDTLVGTAFDDTLDGLGGADTMKGGAGNDVYIVDNSCDKAIEKANNGIDTVLSSVTYSLGSYVENLTLTGTHAINGTGNALDNVLLGNSAANTLAGGSGNDLLNGGSGNDLLKGGSGNDVLEGANGNDTQIDNSGKNLFNGGNGTDKLIGCSGNELYIGGTGNDTITTGTGSDIIAFNTGDGQDTVVASAAADNTLSLGGGIDYANLAMSKSGNNLILVTGPSTGSGQADQITLQNWYSGTGNHSIANLQLVLDGGSYDANSSDPLLNQQVQDFDFAALAQAFDNALAANPSLTSWSMTDTLLSAHLSGSDTAALGGDLAYQYNLNGTLAGIGLASAQTVINDASFGVSAQQLHPLAELQTGTARLG